MDEDEMGMDNDTHTTAGLPNRTRIQNTKRKGTVHSVIIIWNETRNQTANVDLGQSTNNIHPLTLVKLRSSSKFRVHQFDSKPKPNLLAGFH